MFRRICVGSRRLSAGALISLVGLLGTTSGCVAFSTPGGGASLPAIVEGDISERFALQPAAAKPATMAVVRIQGSGYRSYTNEGYGRGAYSVVTTRDIEKDEDFARLQKLPAIGAAGVVPRLLLPENLNSSKELRLAAASMRADVLLIYTFDTRYRIENRDIGPLGVVTLGFLPVNEAQVTSTASAIVIDVRTGFLYCAAESTGREKQIGSAWSSQSAADNSRQIAERRALDGLLVEIEKAWMPVAAGLPERVQAAAK